MLIGPTLKRMPNTIHMKGNALLLFGQFFSFWWYFYDSPFTLVIDHQPLKFFIKLDRFIRKFVGWV
jgi:hypothetical protein